MKVSVEVLRRVYAKLQDQDDDDEIHKDGLNPENHLFFIDAYEMPKWHWSNERGSFERYVAQPQINIIRISKLPAKVRQLHFPFLLHQNRVYLPFETDWISFVNVYFEMNISHLQRYRQGIEKNSSLLNRLNNYLEDQDKGFCCWVCLHIIKKEKCVWRMLMELWFWIILHW